ATCGLVVAGIPFLTRMGLCAAGGVLVAAIAALTLLPALLGFAGNSPTRYLSKGVGERKRRLARHPDSGAGARWSRLVVRHRWVVLVAGVVVLLVLAVPALSMHLGLPTGGTSPTNTTQRKGADLLTDNFGVGLTGPLTTVVEASSATAQPAATATVVDTVRAIDGVVAISQPNVNPAGNLAVLQVVPDTG
nr:MMPL family transporter [Micromonospora sp. DSM 115978]